ncbi:hypothetical protein BV22DRAFT_1027097 [Leucogyrophana mollusca]|uniref:Uncharacterized protein n=1 Tax=Leucogyrophana mollusca TaxID=85980 RepID=A0ACB8AUW2_9AGAM|nr:hypothetical protein BV22DRAFT_1027097 [Leucogyrophana mollusca]
MGTSPWATKEQKTWLQSQLRGFVKAQGSQSLDSFWAPLYSAWFDKFPLAALTQEEIAAEGNCKGLLL